MERLRIASYNIHSGVGQDGAYDIERVGETVKSFDADIVGLQEVENNISLQRTRIWSKPHEHNQTEQIARIAGYDHFIFVTALTSTCDGSCFGLRERHGTAIGQFGIAVLSKLAIIEHHELRYDVFRGKSQRNAVACKVEVSPSRYVWFVTTHLGLHYGAEQAAQMAQLLTFIESVLGGDSGGFAGVVLAGDLNSLPCFRSITLAKQWQWQRRGGKAEGEARFKLVPTAATFPSTFRIMCVPISGLFRLDYMFFLLKQELRLEEAELVDSPASDHQAIVATFI